MKEEYKELREDVLGCQGPIGNMSMQSKNVTLFTSVLKLFILIYNYRNKCPHSG